MNFYLHYLGAICALDLRASAPHLTVALLAIVAPIWDVIEARRLRANYTSQRRIRHYVAVLSLSIAMAGLSVWIVGPSRILTAGRALPDAESLASPSVRIVFLVVAFAFLALAFSPLLRSLQKPEIFGAYTRAIKRSPFHYLFPISVVERRWFGLLCVNAGFCEEVIFRSFLLDYFHQSPWNLGPYLALAASSLIFGLNHAYQGFGGILRTGITGGIMGLLYFATGSLILCMVVHALVDLQVLAMLKPGWADGLSAPQAATETAQ